MQGFLNRINKTVEILWDEYSKKYPGFFFKDQNNRKNMPKIIAAQTMLNLPDFPLYAKRYVDQDPTSWYFMMAASPLAGASDRDTAVQLFHDIFHNQLGMKSSFEDEGYDDMTAADMEVLPAENDKNYKTYFEQQMEELAKMMGAAPDEEAEKKAADDEFEQKFGFRRDDPDIIDVEVDDPGAPKAQQKPGIQKAQTFAVGGLKPIWYAVDLHVPANYELGFDGGGRGGRLGGGRGPGRRLGGPGGGLRRLRESDLDAMMQEAEQAKILAYNGCKYGNAAPGGNILSLNGFAFYTNNELTSKYARPERVVNGSVAFERGKEGAKTQADTFKNVNVVQYANGELRLRANMDGGIETMGQFLDQAKKAGVKKFQDIKFIRLDDPDNGSPLGLYGIGVKNVSGDKNFPYAFLFDEGNDMANKKDEFDDYRNMFESDDMEECDACGDPECKDGELCGLKEAELSQGELDDIAGMFAGYSGGSSLNVGRQALDRYMDAHATELLGLKRSQASGFGDFSAAQDLGSDDEQYESEEIDEAYLSQEDRDEIADMFAGYSTGPAAVQDWMLSHADELRALRRSQANGLGDFNAARDLGNDDETPNEQYESEEDIEKEIAGIVNEGDESDEDVSETEKLIKEYGEVEDEVEEDDDELSESVIRHANMLSREIW